MRFVLCLALCYFVLVFSVLLALRLPRLGKREQVLVLVWFCLFPLPLGVWDGLRFVIVVFPGLFSYTFMNMKSHNSCGNGLTQYLASVRKPGNRRSSGGLRTFSPSYGTNLAVLLILAGDTEGFAKSTAKHQIRWWSVK